MDVTEPMDCNASDTSSSTPSDVIEPSASNLKRTASDAGLKTNGTRPNKSVKRRAAKACQCCRNRKVRCNVVEHGAPCTNCRLDEVECIVSESKRKKKVGGNDSVSNSKSTMRRAPPDVPLSAYPPYAPLRRQSEHVPHALYQDVSKDACPATAARNPSLFTPNMLFNLQRLGQRSESISDTTPFIPQLPPQDSSPAPILPAYIKPLPAKFGQDDIIYLRNKGALTIPDTELRDQLMKSFIENIHPYMPLLDLNSLVRAIDGNNGLEQISLLLFQSIMFAAVASVEMMYLKNAGYATRREARRDFFNKTRLLYDFDYEADRVSLIQALLLMTYWYETPDDQKDSQHWMGIAVSLSHTIGLHRSPEKTAVVNPGRKKLWKRIWWSTYMRDRLIALGMRRPTRIKDSDFDVPMLELEDFEVTVLPGGPSCIPADCNVMRDSELQRQLAIMCIEKAKLCVCVSNVLSVQYSVLHAEHGASKADDGNMRTTGMLVANRIEPGSDSVQACDMALQDWKANLPVEAQYTAPTWTDVDSGNESIVLNRSLLHMVYFATLSALHRPQVLPGNGLPPRSVQAEVIEMSRKAVRLAAIEITAIGHVLHTLDLVRLLPTTGVTVLLPAIIIHLLDIKAPGESTRRASLQGFCQCMSIMAKLRDIYAAADYSTAFLEAAIRKAEITLPQKPDEVKEPRNVITSTQGLLDAGKRLHLTGGVEPGNLTPPPEDLNVATESLPNANTGALSDTDIARRLSNYLNSTPPPSDRTSSGSDNETDHRETIFNDGAIMVGHAYAGFGGEGNGDFELDFDSMVDLDAHGMEEGSCGALQGESGGFALDMDWMKSMGIGGAEEEADGFQGKLEELEV